MSNWTPGREVGDLRRSVRNGRLVESVRDGYLIEQKPGTPGLPDVPSLNYRVWDGTPGGLPLPVSSLVGTSGAGPNQ